MTYRKPTPRKPWSQIKIPPGSDPYIEWALGPSKPYFRGGSGARRLFVSVLLRLDGLTARSVTKKMKQLSFAAAVNRDDIRNGAEDFGVDLGEHIGFCVSAMQTIADELGLVPNDQEA